MRLFGERAPGMSWKMIDEQFFGAQPGIPDYEEQPGDVRPDLTARLEETIGWVFAQIELDDLDRLTEHRNRTIEMRAGPPRLDRHCPIVSCGTRPRVVSRSTASCSTSTCSCRRLRPFRSA